MRFVEREAVNWPDADHEAIARLVETRTGLVFPEARRGALIEAVRRGCLRTGTGTPHAFYEGLAGRTSWFEDLVAELTVGETFFFREPLHFQWIREVILPEFVKRSDRHQIFQAWSAGCSTGEEAYSLAILLSEFGMADQSMVHASDLSVRSIFQAKQARYSSWSIRQGASEPVMSYLHRDGKFYCLEEAIQRLVRFSAFNLMWESRPSTARGLGGFDLIMCRNVLIYFHKTVVGRIFTNLLGELAPGGWLILASSDPHNPCPDGYHTVMNTYGIFYRRDWEQGGDVRAAATLSVPQLHDGTGFGLAKIEPLQEQEQEQEQEREREQERRNNGEGDPARGELRPGGGRRDAFSWNVPYRPGRKTLPECLERIHRTANRDLDAAERLCRDALTDEPYHEDLLYLLGMIRLERGCHEEAAGIFRRLIFWSPSLTMAHFALGTALARMKDYPNARKSYRNARALCTAGADLGRIPVPLSDHVTHEELARTAELQMRILEQLEWEADASTPAE